MKQSKTKDWSKEVTGKKQAARNLKNGVDNTALHNELLVKRNNREETCGNKNVVVIKEHSPYVNPKKLAKRIDNMPKM